jgi:hypothetical protein
MVIEMYDDMIRISQWLNGCQMLRNMAKSNFDFSLLPAVARSRAEPAGAIDNGYAAGNPHLMNSAIHPRRKGRSLWSHYWRQNRLRNCWTYRSGRFTATVSVWAASIPQALRPFGSGGMWSRLSWKVTASRLIDLIERCRIKLDRKKALNLTQQQTRIDMVYELKGVSL